VNEAALERALAGVAGKVGRARPRFDQAEVPVARPDSIDGFAETLRFAARAKLRVVPVGGGTKLGWCRPAERADFLLSTGRFAGVVAHVPDDGTITARAGTPMGELRRAAREGGHFLTPDVAVPEPKTLGGVVAAGESALDRIRFGPLRHHVLGATVALGDGSVAKSGGALVKNVTGFDLHRLYTGSHGTLCVVLEVSLRLFPEPEHELRVAHGAADARSAFELARAALAQPIRFAALAISRIAPPRDREAWSLVARLFGRRAAVERERELLARAWKGASFVSGSDARVLADGDRDELAFHDVNLPSLHVECAPSKCSAVWEALAPRLSIGFNGRRAAIQPALAAIDVELHEVASAERLGLAVLHIRKLLAPLGASVGLRNAPAAALASLDPFGDEPPGIELMRDLKRALDPEGVFASGRFAAGL
jgi:glycolate oxidase FAD binding subunit